MTSTIFYTATSLDGFIADPDNSLEWLLTRKQNRDGPLNYDAFIADVGAVAMGRTTYEWVLDTRTRRGRTPSRPGCSPTMTCHRSTATSAS